MCNSFKSPTIAEKKRPDELNPDADARGSTKKATTPTDVVTELRELPSKKRRVADSPDFHQDSIQVLRASGDMLKSDLEEMLQNKIKISSVHAAPLRGDAAINYFRHNSQPVLSNERRLYLMERPTMSLIEYMQNYRYTWEGWVPK
jgi:hypothetical protein